MRILSQKGFSLISVLVAGGIAAGISTFLLGVVDLGNKGSNSVSQKVDYDILRQSIQTVLGSSATCKGGLVNSSGLPARLGPSETNDFLVREIRLSSPSGFVSIAKEGETYGGLLLKSIELIPELSPIPNSPSAGFTTQHVRMIVRMTKIGKSIGVAEITNASNPYRFAVVTNGTNEIVDCAPSVSGLGSGGNNPLSNICDGTTLIGRGRPAVKSDLPNCCPGGGPSTDCRVTGVERFTSRTEVFYLCGCNPNATTTSPIAGGGSAPTSPVSSTTGGTSSGADPGTTSGSTSAGGTAEQCRVGDCREY